MSIKPILTARLENASGSMSKQASKYVRIKAMSVLNSDIPVFTKHAKHFLSKFEKKNQAFVKANSDELNLSVANTLLKSKKELEPRLCIPSFPGAERLQFINDYAKMRPQDKVLQTYKNICNYFA